MQKIQKDKAETMSAIRRHHKQTNIKMGKKLSNFLDIKSTKKIQKNTKIPKSKAETMAAIRRDHKQTNIKMGKKLSNFLDITNAKNTEKHENTKKQSRD